MVQVPSSPSIIRVRERAAWPTPVFRSHNTAPINPQSPASVLENRVCYGTLQGGTEDESVKSLGAGQQDGDTVPQHEPSGPSLSCVCFGAEDDEVLPGRVHQGVIHQRAG